jgi:hypothetical protein
MREEPFLPTVPFSSSVFGEMSVLCVPYQNLAKKVMKMLKLVCCLHTHCYQTTLRENSQQTLQLVSTSYTLPHYEEH